MIYFFIENAWVEFSASDFNNAIESQDVTAPSATFDLDSKSLNISVATTK